MKNRPDNTSIYDNEQNEKVKKSFSLKIILEIEGKILLVSNEHTGELTIPGGRGKIGESERDTIYRELLEETGVEIPAEIEFKEIHTSRTVFRSPKDGNLRDITAIFYYGKLDNIKGLNSKSKLIEIEKAIDCVSFKREKIAIQKIINI
jgi:ADP-ribose pyrophosphatase YjhB (NUDIX family)